MLYLKSFEKADNQQRKELLQLYSTEGGTEKIETVKRIFTETQATDFVRNEIENYTKQALQILDELDINAEKRLEIKRFAIDLMDRKI